MQFTAPHTSSFREDATCGFLGGAMAGFNAGLWFLPHAGILTPLQALALCMACGAISCICLTRASR